MKTANVSDLIQVSKAEADAIYEKILDAREELDKLSKRREVNFDAWARKPYQEQPGRSKYQASDVFDQVESTFPSLMGRVLATDHQIRIKGPDQMVAKALLVKVREMIGANNAFLLYSCAIKDGLLSVAGAVKLWWAKTFQQNVDQRSGLPQDAIDVLKAGLERGEIEDLQIIPEPIETAEYEPNDGVTQAVIVQQPPTFTAEVTTIEVVQSQAQIVPLPPQQVLVERGKAAINDRRGIGHQTVMTVGELLDMQDRLSIPGEPFFDVDALQKAVARAKKDESSGQQAEREAREQLHYNISRDGSLLVGMTPGDLRREITVVEWSDTVSEVDGARLVPALLWYGGDVLLRSQRNREGIVPICMWSPYIVPHSAIGMGVAEQHVHEQDTRSAMGRALVDHVARAVDEETYVLNEATDIMGLKQRIPGQLVYSEPGKDFVRGQSNVLDAKLFQAMDWMKTNIQDTGPANRWTQGRDVDPRNTTATGQQIMAAASSSKQNMIALVFTEIFQVDLYNKLVKLLQHNCDDFTVTVEDQIVTLTNADIQGDYIAYSEVGRQFDLNDRELMRAQMVMQQVMGLAQAMPMLVGPQQVYNASKKVLLAAGEPVVADYLTPPPTPEELMMQQMAMQQQMMASGALPPGAAPAMQGQPPVPMSPGPPGAVAGNPGPPRPDRAHGQAPAEEMRAM